MIEETLSQKLPHFMIIKLFVFRCSKYSISLHWLQNVVVFEEVVFNFSLHCFPVEFVSNNIRVVYFGLQLDGLFLKPVFVNGPIVFIIILIFLILNELLFIHVPFRVIFVHFRNGFFASQVRGLGSVRILFIRILHSRLRLSSCCVSRWLIWHCVWVKLGWRNYLVWARASQSWFVFISFIS